MDCDPDSLAWETLDGRTVYECEGFTIRNEDVRFPDGSDAEFDYLVDEDSVVVLPFAAEDWGDGGYDDEDEGREVVVIEEWRQAVGRVNRGLPAGGMVAGEDPLDAARRELTEETGYVADSVEHLATFEPANGVLDAVFHYVVAAGCTPDGDQQLDYNESIRVDTTSLSDLQRSVAEGELLDGRSALAILYHQLHGD